MATWCAKQESAHPVWTGLMEVHPPPETVPRETDSRHVGGDSLQHEFKLGFLIMQSHTKQMEIFPGLTGNLP